MQHIVSFVFCWQSNQGVQKKNCHCQFTSIHVNCCAWLGYDLAFSSPEHCTHDQACLHPQHYSHGFFLILLSLSVILHQSFVFTRIGHAFVHVGKVPMHALSCHSMICYTIHPLKEPLWSILTLVGHIKYASTIIIWYTLLSCFLCSNF